MQFTELLLAGGYQPNDGSCGPTSVATTQLWQVPAKSLLNLVVWSR